MRLKILFLLCFSILTVASAFAQTKSVTNADLEKFRQKRLDAEKDYRENYAKLGFPSPEELDRQLEKSRIEREALAARLTAERLQRERLEAEREEALRYVEQGNYMVQDNVLVANPSYYGYTNVVYYGRRFPRRQNYNFPIRVGNGFPVGTYGSPIVRPVRPSSRWLRP